jgi:hypothetical protein
MTQVINSGGGGDSSVGLIVGVIIALALIAVLYFVFVGRGDVADVDGPDINISTPATPDSPVSNP